jgi:hypothetical protein
VKLRYNTPVILVQINHPEPETNTDFIQPIQENPNLTSGDSGTVQHSVEDVLNIGFNKRPLAIAWIARWERESPPGVSALFQGRDNQSLPK